MVEMSDPKIPSEATLINIRNARKHFEKLEKVSSSAPSQYQWITSVDYVVNFYKIMGIESAKHLRYLSEATLQSRVCGLIAVICNVMDRVKSIALKKYWRNSDTAIKRLTNQVPSFRTQNNNLLHLIGLGAKLDRHVTIFIMRTDYLLYNSDKYLY